MSVDKSGTLCYIYGHRKTYEFSSRKNELLFEERKVSFKDMIDAIEDDGLIAMIDHNNQIDYPHQQLFIVSRDNYIYAVPFVTKNETTVFLKTIFRSRKLTRKYLNLRCENENEKTNGKTVEKNKKD